MDSSELSESLSSGSLDIEESDFSIDSFSLNDSSQKNYQDQKNIPARDSSAEKSGDKNYPCSENMKFASSLSFPKVEPIPISNNLLIPDFSLYKYCTILIFETKMFQQRLNSNKNYFLVIRLHPELDNVSTPIEFGGNPNIKYNIGYTYFIQHKSFINVVPVVEAYDFISEDRQELVGVSYLSIQRAINIESKYVVYNNERVPFQSVCEREIAGYIKMTLLFHNDNDITQFYSNNGQKIADISTIDSSYSNIELKTISVQTDKIENTSSKYSRDNMAIIEASLEAIPVFTFSSTIESMKKDIRMIKERKCIETQIVGK